MSKLKVVIPEFKHTNQKYNSCFVETPKFK